MSDFSKLPPLQPNLIGRLFHRDGTSSNKTTFERIADWICGINRDAANAAVARLESDCDDADKIEAFDALQALVAEPFKQHFQKDLNIGFLRVLHTGIEIHLSAEHLFKPLEGGADLQTKGEHDEFGQPASPTSRQTARSTGKFGQPASSTIDPPATGRPKFGQRNK